MRQLAITNVFRDSEKEYFSGRTLGKDDLIVRDGRRMKVSTYLKRHGKDGVWDLLHYFDLEDEILEEYNIHAMTAEEYAMRMQKLNEVENVPVENIQESTSVSSPVQEDFVTSTTTDIVENDNRTPDVIKEDYMNSVLYDPEDPPVDPSFYNPSKTGWNYHPSTGVPVGTMRKPNYNTYKYERN